MSHESEVKRIVDAVRSTRANKGVIRIIGAGTWMDAGKPVTSNATLDTRALQGIVAYEPGDLTITVGAGTSLSEIAAATAEHGQWLPLDPYGDPGGTVGSTIATASIGPLASLFGTPRDQILGCEFVTGRAEVARGGGRVVKNVAGFDLVRLMTGAWGTLGVLTEVTMRLRAVPEADCTFAISTSAEASWNWLRTSEVAPLAAELLSPALARKLGVGDTTTLLLRLAGNDALVQTGRNGAGALGPLREVDGDVWQQLAVAEPMSAAVVRFSFTPSRANDLWNRVAPAADAAGGFAHYTVPRGVVRCVIPGSHAGLQETFLAMRAKATCVGEKLPAHLWATVPTPDPNKALAERVQNAFDPDRVLNRGILG